MGQHILQTLETGGHSFKVAHCENGVEAWRYKLKDT